MNNRWVFRSIALVIALALVVVAVGMIRWIERDPKSQVNMAKITLTNTPDGKCHEDDPCWDCTIMGNRICGTTIYVKGRAYDINDEQRPGCFVEPSDTPEQYEVIYYPHLSMEPDVQGGFEIACPEGAK